MNKNNKSLHQTVFNDFDYDSSYGQKVCFNCGVIDPHPLLITTTELSHCRPSSKPNITVYLKKCNAEHEEQYNCSILYDIYDEFKKFRLCFIKMFPNEQKTSLRYTLYPIPQLYDHRCSETSFIIIKQEESKMADAKVDSEQFMVKSTVLGFRQSACS